MNFSRTPFRISFVGGGTDFQKYYKKNDYGAVVSTTINKYMYIVVNKKFDDKIRLSYSELEIVDDIEQLNHDLIKEVLRMTKIRNGIEVVTIADIPGKGTGLGSSSSLTVGLVNSLFTMQNNPVSKEILAQKACNVEIDILGEPIGKQDQYAASYGGLNYIRFNADETVDVIPINLSKNTAEELEKNILCYYTGVTRKSSAILTTQKENIESRTNILTRMRDQADEIKLCLTHNDLTRFGEILHDGWVYKKQLANGITHHLIDNIYNKARTAGALGGKICGAGGGGFLVLYCEEEKQDKVKKVLKNLLELDIKFEYSGSLILYE